MRCIQNLLFSLLTIPVCAADIDHSPTSYSQIENQATLPLLNPQRSEQQIDKIILNNGLEVYLLSDPKAEQSAAGLAVEAGSWKDPKEYPGLAHFLEHMLFMGNEAYPKEFEYMQFISDHGGKVNAYTASDRTVYMFSVNNDAFEPALDRFSHFFIDPLFLPNCINRELHAVDQEHSKNIEHDGWRQYMILKETGNPNHPNRTFSTGNAQTLSGIPQEALKQWYQTHYSANKMHLVMISPLPLEKMKELAIADFSKVISRDIEDPLTIDPLTSPVQQGHMIYIKPIKDIKQLSLLWEIPNTFASDIERQAPQLLAYALEQEGPNSLIATLKKEHLAEAIHVSCDRFSKNTLLFSIDLSLTDQGIQHINTAILRSFQALARLKKEGIPESLFREIQTIAKINYQYHPKQDTFATVIQLTDDLVYEDIGTFPEKTYIPAIYDPVFINQFIHSLKATNCVYFVLADPLKTGVVPNTKEQWMGAEYTIKTIPSSHLTAWNETPLYAPIQLPQSNPYLPTRFELVAANTDPSTSITPQLLCSNSGSQVYFAQDTRYLVPEIATSFTFKSPLINASAQSQVLTDLYLRALTEQLSSTLFFASTARMKTRFDSDDFSLRLTLQGFNDKASLLLNTIFQAFHQVIPSKEQFDVYCASLASDYDNASKELPLRQASEIMDNIIFNTATCADKYKSIKEIRYEDFLVFAKNLFTKTYTEAMLYGNLTQSQAQQLWQELNQTLQTQPFVKAEHTHKKILILPHQYGPYMISQQTSRQGNGVILLIEEGEYTSEKRAAQQILGNALSDAFFDTLRTKQQTAYIAKAIAIEKERQLLQYFAVQSSTHSPLELLGRFELFLEDFNKNFPQIISKNRFDNIRSNIITLLKMPPDNMMGMLRQLNDLAFEYQDFNWIHKRIKSCEELTYEKFSQLSHQFLSRNNSRRLAVLMEGTILKHHNFRYELISKEEIVSRSSFVSVNQ